MLVVQIHKDGFVFSREVESVFRICGIQTWMSMYTCEDS